MHHFALFHQSGTVDWEGRLQSESQCSPLGLPSCPFYQEVWTTLLDILEQNQYIIYTLSAGKGC